MTSDNDSAGAGAASFDASHTAPGATHTPGPWAPRLGVDGLWVIAAAETDRTFIAIAREVDLDADARLIAAAPDLKDAVQLFLKQWNACGSNSDFGRYFSNVRNAAEAAYKRATKA